MMALGAGVVGENLALEITDTWLGTAFSGEPRHQRRIDKLMALENHRHLAGYGLFRRTPPPAPHRQADGPGGSIIPPAADNFQRRFLFFLINPLTFSSCIYIIYI